MQVASLFLYSSLFKPFVSRELGKVRFSLLIVLWCLNDVCRLDKSSCSIGFQCLCHLLNCEIWFQVLSAHFRAYIQALEKLQLDIATAYDLIGVETRSSTGLFSRAREPLKNRSAVFALGERIKIIKVFIIW